MKRLAAVIVGSMGIWLGTAPAAWAGSYVNHCTCDKVDNYSSTRVMGIGSNWKFELECNNHGGHGWCSNNVDSAHGAGCGAMKGTLKLYTPTQMKTNECSDDHYTCFRGPSTCDGGGSWGVTCRCDTVHSTGSTYATFSSALSLTDTLDVLQNILYNPVYGKATLGTRVVTAPGTCNPTVDQVWWNNSIKEHDPICCDDQMGVVVNSVKPFGANWTVNNSYAQTTLIDDGNPGTWSVAADVHGFNCRTVSYWCGASGENITWSPSQGIYQYCCPGLTSVLVSGTTYRCTTPLTAGVNLADAAETEAPAAPALPQTQGDSNWKQRCAADPQCAAWQREQKAAVAATVPARRAQLQALLKDAEEQERIQSRVARHAAALRVAVPTGELFDLLAREYELAIESDDCNAKDNRSQPCQQIRAGLAALHDEFHKRTTYTVSEFRQGRRDYTDEELLEMQQMAEQQEGRLYFVRSKADGEVAPRLITEQEAEPLLQEAAKRQPR